MTNDLVSIIIPVYNVAPYLDRCVQSACNQTYRNIEIILVDDGSTDESGEKCDHWAEKDSRIVVVHQKNSGVSAARNTGLKAAKGEFRCSRRMMIDITLHRGDEVIYEGCALNDAYIHGYGDTIILHAMCDGQTITSFSGDGIIFSTPTGSTGYSLSAGGPVVEPETDNIIVTPICAHTMVSRTFVLGPERVASVTATRLHDRRAYLSVDGYVSADIRKDDVLTVKRSRRKVIFADLGAKSFYENTYEKLT